MSCTWVSVSDCNQSHIFQLTQLLRQDKDLQIILSYGAPGGDNRGSGSAQRRIERLLSRIGMPSHLKGYQYLKTALEICLNDMEALDGITKRLYPEVAKKHKTTKEKVEHAVRHAIESAWKRGDEREHKNLFGYCQTEGKRPTNAEFITRMADYLLHDTTSFLS